MSAVATHPPPPARGNPSSAVPPARRPLWRLALDFFSSLRLTVVLLALSILVVFFGTLAQTEDGLYVAQEKYFRSLFAVWSPHTPGWQWLKIPLPGGYLLGVLLLINLLAAHATRFKFAWKKSGILLTHLGIILLLVGQLTTDMFARESRMRFAEGDWRNYTEDFHKFELAVLVDVADPTLEQVVVFPESRIQSGTTLTHSTLPFSLRIQEFMPNSDPAVRGDPAFQGIGRQFGFIPQPVTRAMDSKNVPTAVVEVVEPGGQILGRWVLSGWAGDADLANVLFASWSSSFERQRIPDAQVQAHHLVESITAPQTFETGGRTFTLVLRPERYYQPFSLDLQQVTHETYQGSKIPKNYQSRVRLDNPVTGENREVDIYMNNPLRYGGLTFFQHQMVEAAKTIDGRPVTVFQVVRNPVWLTPYLGTLVVGLGLMVQFSIHLVGFLRKRPAR